ncbi:MAG: SIS domain-containing protein [Candidatus Omnitrophica bacterium]|nr:SIS domain-containing protein [Candidatus Omnitrophota bacterium]
MSTDLIRSIAQESAQANKDFFSVRENIDALSTAADQMSKTFTENGKIIVFGNGGSAADSEHLAAELVVRFEKERKALPCIALSANTSNLTACGNDYSFDDIFSRQVEALAVKEDLIFAISTSGNSKNVIKAVNTAKKKGCKVVALTGKDGGELIKLADISINVKNKVTARVQEIHILIIHILCKIVEASL